MPQSGQGREPSALTAIFLPNLDCTSGVDTAVLSSAYSTVVANNSRRRWLVITCLRDSSYPVSIVPTNAVPGGTPNRYGQIYLAQGDSVVFSETGDMPWRGGVYAIGIGGTASIRWTEAERWPIA